MMRFLQALGCGLILLIVVLVGRALMLTPPLVSAAPILEIDVDGETVARHLSESIRFETISRQAPQTLDPAMFEGFIEWALRAYPEVHQKLELERVGTYSLLYTWAGSDPALAPILLTGHYDVVPVLPGSEGDWAHPPFEGKIADGYVWGRGALDDKSAVVTMYEAATRLLVQGFAPRRTIYFAFDHDEELGGHEGAGAVTKLLQSRGIELDWTLDEGSFFIQGLLPGIEAPIASINVAEKGYVTFEIVARGEGGHSSLPPPHTAVGTLASAIVKIEDHPLPGGIEGLMAEGLDAIAPHAPFTYRIVLANRWLFDPLLEMALSGAGAASAMLRTTTAATMLSASVKENVLPIEAIATVNFRLHPRDTAEDVAAHLKKVIQDDEIEIRQTGMSSAASSVSSTQSEGFQDIAAAARDVVGSAIVMPGLTVGGTDSRHFSQTARDAYRFNPMVVTRDDISGFHGTNERISIENLELATRFYLRLIQRSAGNE
jgi:carboxypeptidase PM20D1